MLETDTKSFKDVNNIEGNGAIVRLSGGGSGEMEETTQTLLTLMWRRQHSVIYPRTNVYTLFAAQRCHYRNFYRFGTEGIGGLFVPLCKIKIYIGKTFHLHFFTLSLCIFLNL